MFTVMLEVMLAIIGISVVVAVTVAIVAFIITILNLCMIPGLIIQVFLKPIDYIITPLIYHPLLRVFRRSKITAVLFMIICYGTLIGYNAVVFPYSIGELYSLPAYWAGMLGLPKKAIVPETLDYTLLWWEEPVPVRNRVVNAMTRERMVSAWRYFGNDPYDSKVLNGGRYRPFPSLEISRNVWRSHFIYANKYIEWTERIKNDNEQRYLYYVQSVALFVLPGIVAGILTLLIDSCWNIVLAGKIYHERLVRFLIFVFVALFHWSVFSMPYFSHLSYNTQGDNVISALLLTGDIWFALQFKLLKEPLFIP